MDVTVVIPVGSAMVDEWGRRCARRLIELGVPIALGTGLGVSTNGGDSMLDTLRAGCDRLGLSPAEALVASTVNAAFASGVGDDIGSLEPGKRADLLIVDLPSYSHLPYQSSTDPIRAVVKDGWVVVEEGCRVA